MTDTRKAVEENTAGGEGFTAEERAAMRERAAELRAESRRSKAADKTAADLEDALTAIAEMPEPDRGLAERIHAIITATAPDLAAKTWYGMPAWARSGKVVCFFQPAAKFKYRYATLGFQDEANLDDGTIWPTVYAITRIGDAEAAQIEDLVRRAVS